MKGFQQAIDAVCTLLTRMAHAGGDDRGLVYDNRIGVSVYSPEAHLKAQLAAVRSLKLEEVKQPTPPRPARIDLDNGHYLAADGATNWLLCRDADDEVIRYLNRYEKGFVNAALAAGMQQ